METEKRPIWTTWTGKRVTSTYGEIFIATTKEQWHNRMQIWKQACHQNNATTCPRPMPEGHIIFDDEEND